jgi:hypothetical protein
MGACLVSLCVVGEGLIVGGGAGRLLMGNGLAASVVVVLFVFV